MSPEAMLAARYPSPEWATFFEVQNGTGWEYNRPGRKARRADALAFGIWPSRGYAVHGFEIKRSRADWLSELADLTKSDAVGVYCDRWWLVLSEAKIALDSEVPETWGILAPKGAKLVALRDAPKREAVPLTRPQIAAILRQVGETTVPKSIVDKMIDERVEQAVKRAAPQYEYAQRARDQELDKLKQEVAAFHEASGLYIGQYTGGRSLGERVAKLSHFSSVTGPERLEQAKRQLLELVSFIDRDLGVISDLAKVGS